MSPIAASNQSQTALDAQRTTLKATAVRRWKSLARMLDPKEEPVPPLRQTPLAINIERVSYDINDLEDSDFTPLFDYSPELAAIVSSGGRSKRWAFCLTSTPNESHDREEGDRDARPEEEGDRRPTLYLILDPDQDPSSSSEVRMLVGKKEEVCGKTGAVIHSKRGRERSTERLYRAASRIGNYCTDPTKGGSLGLSSSK
ncbi:hypothetical protein BJ322DRAFT_387823 [Thelephora terrestris]|uniref:Uncharacterized protein n=1 Tax=Thelephora terrestris TaxID=56493 RepID=A0A9P6LB67_9AGAM|nr:hypothetical protein BJ322DRAFT_387823 [Thelephora terrestris]